jgi:hypothetical protein
LGGSVLYRSRHVCAFFHSKDEEYSVLLPFIKEGIEQGEKACHIVESKHHPKHRLRMRECGIDCHHAEFTRQLAILAWEDAYLKHGYFNQERQIALIEKLLTDGKEQGYPMTRLVANMEWALQNRPGVADLVEYETRLNYVLPKYDDVVVCTYDLAQFRGDVVMDIMLTHPMVIIRGSLRPNPLFVPPDEMLEYLRQHKQTAT